MKNYDLSFRTYSKHSNVYADALNDELFYHELTFLLSGKLHYRIDGADVYLNAGDFVYLKPGSRRRRFKPEKPATFVSINVWGNIQESLLPQHLFKDFCKSEEVITILDYIDKAYNCRNFDKFILLTEYLLSCAEEQHDNAHVSPQVLKIKNHILNNITRTFTISDVAKQVYLSPVYCERLFKRETGKSIMSFVNEEKIRTAKNYLKQPDFPPVKIAEFLGFNDYNYFARLFKKITGVSPTYYKRLKRIPSEKA